MKRLISVNKTDDIFPRYKNTPIGLLLEYQNLGRQHEQYEKARLLVGMCMDNRKYLKIPENFAYIIRTGGGNLRYSDFKVSFAIAIGKVRSIALIGHNHCGMVNLKSRKKEFIDGLVTIAGWAEKQAEEHFEHYAGQFDIGNEIDFLISETARLRICYPKIQVAPLFYRIDDNLLYQVKEDE